MYDKYTSASQFSVNQSKLPKHKGLLFTNNNKSGDPSTATMQFLNVSGATTNINFYIPVSSHSFVSMEAYAGVTMQSGVTGWLLN